MKNKEKAGYSTISLPTPLINKIKEKIKGTGIHSPSAYVTFILREILSGDGIKEETDIKKKLKNLGYL